MDNLRFEILKLVYRPDHSPDLNFATVKAFEKFILDKELKEEPKQVDNVSNKKSKKVDNLFD